MRAEVGSGQRIALGEAHLHLHQRPGPARPGPARQHPAGTGRRSRSVGEVASLCLLDADPEVTHPHDMPRMTLLDGRVVHRVD
jgi:hypothetical protein